MPATRSTEPLKTNEHLTLSVHKKTNWKASNVPLLIQLHRLHNVYHQWRELDDMTLLQRHNVKLRGNHVLGCKQCGRVEPRPQTDHNDEQRQPRTTNKSFTTCSTCSWLLQHKLKKLEECKRQTIRLHELYALLDFSTIQSVEEEQIDHDQNNMESS